LTADEARAKCAAQCAGVAARGACGVRYARILFVARMVHTEGWQSSERRTTFVVFAIDANATEREARVPE